MSASKAEYLKKKDLVAFHNFLTGYKALDESVRKEFPKTYTYKSTLNLKTLEREIEAIREVEKPLIDLDTEYKTIRKNLIEAKAVKKEDGTFEVKDGKYVFESPEVETKVIKEIEVETKDIIEKMTEESRKIEEFHNEPSELTLNDFAKFDINKDIPKYMEEKPDDIEFLTELGLIVSN